MWPEWKPNRRVGREEGREARCCCYKSPTSNNGVSALKMSFKSCGLALCVGTLSNLMIVQLPQANRELLRKESEQLDFLAGTALELRGNLLHRPNNILVAEQREFALAPGIVE